MENYRRKKEDNELIKRFEEHLKNHTPIFLALEAFEEIVAIYQENAQ